jgi:hypothetical protein
MPSPAAQALSMFQSILLFHGQSINHDNVLYISNYYIIIKQKVISPFCFDFFPLSLLVMFLTLSTNTVPLFNLPLEMLLLTIICEFVYLGV